MEWIDRGGGGKRLGTIWGWSDLKRVESGGPKRCKFSEIKK